MAGTPTNNLTNITNAEAADDVYWDDIGGGVGSGQTANVFIQGAEGRGRKVDNIVLGFSFDAQTVIDLSASGIHVGFWVNVLQFSLLSTDGIELLLGDDAAPKAGNWSGWVGLTAATYPVTGGFKRLWLDPTSTRDYGSGTLPTSLRHFGAEFDMGDISGNVYNCFMDSIDYTVIGLSLTGGTSGSPATFQDLITKSATDDAGILDSTFLDGPIKIGGANSYFRDANFAFKAGYQPLAAADWIRIDFDLALATSENFLDAGFLQGIGLNITGTGGNLDIGPVTFLEAPAITLNSAVVLDGTSFVSSGLLTIGGADVSNVLVSKPSGSVGVATNDLDELDGFTFVSDGTGHAVEMTLSASDTQGWNCTDSGYTAASSGNETIKVNISSPNVLTINVAAGASTPSVYTVGTGTVNVVSGQVTMTVTVKDAITKTAIEGVAVTVKAKDGTGPLPYQDSVSLVRSGSTVTVTHAGHGIADGKKAWIDGADQNEYNRIKTTTWISADSYSFQVSGTPTTPATGTIVATGIVIDGVTNASGIISDTRAYSIDQPVTGSAKKGSTVPVYQPGSIDGTVDTANGLDVTLLLNSD